MKKLIRGIVDFRNRARPDYRDTFARLALEQKPDALFIACSDSRVVPNLFASTDPGDLFVLRNVGNLIPPCGPQGVSVSDESEISALEFALLNLNVPDIIVCGHSECGAMKAVSEGREKINAPHLKNWLRHGLPALERLNQKDPSSWKLPKHNELSRLNVLQQIEHLKSYPLVQERIAAGNLRIHGWWFDIGSANVHAYDPEGGEFHLIDEKEAQEILKRLGDSPSLSGASMRHTSCESHSAPSLELHL